MSGTVERHSIIAHTTMRPIEPGMRVLQAHSARSLSWSEPALRAIAEIVHDIDLKDAKFDRDESPGALASP
jgi:hypothetical protein